MKAGFIGLGTMGAGMALNLIKGGAQVVVNDINRAAGERHLKAGATWGDSPKAIAQQCDVIFTSLPGPPEVEQVALGANGLFEGISAGKAWFDLSTNSPTLIRRLHKKFAEKGAHVFDAPVSGGPAGANSGKLAIWVGGDKAVFDKFLPVMKNFSDKPYYVGEIGAGAVAKLVHNCSGYIIQHALAETFSMGIKAGVDPIVLWEAVRFGALGRRGTFDRLTMQYLPGKYDPPDFALKLAHKDVALACEVGREFLVPMKLAHTALAEMTEGLNRGWGQRDSRVSMLLQNERAGITVKVDEAELKKAIDRG